MFRTTFYILTLTLIFFSLKIYSQTTKWEIEKNKNGVIVYTRKTDASPIKEFRAVTTIDAGFKDLVKILDDTENYPNWMANCDFSKTLKKVNDNERIDYVKIKVPWPLGDRDMISKYKYTIDYEKGVYLAVITTKPDYIDEVKGFVRFRKGKGFWKLEEIGDKVKVTYQFCGDPEMSVPAWIINIFIVDGPYDTLINLKKQLK